VSHFLNNADLTTEIIHCQTNNIISSRLAKMLMLFVTNYGRKSCWRGYSFLADMEADALLQLMKTNIKGNDYRPTVLKFDCGYAARKADLTNTTSLPANPFAWITQVVKNSFVRRIKLEKRHAELRDSLLIDAAMTPSISRQLQNEDDRSSDPIPERLPRKRYQRALSNTGNNSCE
jgi:hypothetical protein